MLEREVLQNLVKSSGRAITAFLCAAACILSIAMLLSFPVIRAHSFGEHFGTTEVRQNIVRHTFVAGPEAAGVEKIAHIEWQAAVPMPVVVENLEKSFLSTAIVSHFPTFRILRHLKLGPARSGTSDPLL